jgi:BatD DUF11 like domain
MSGNRVQGIRRAAWALLAVFIAAAAFADDPLVYATIQPAQILLGESAQFTITNLGDGTNPITMPVVAGLKFEIIGRTREVQLINGTTLPSSSIIMRVTPQMAGIFTIPAVTPKAQPLVLQVNASLAGTTRPSPGGLSHSAPPAPIPPPILSGASIPKGVHLTDDGSAYVRLSIPKREVYVGESVPVEIEVGMRSGFVSSLNGLPKLSDDNFALNNLSHQPERTEKLINGEPFVLLTWRSTLAVVKPGAFSLSAEAPLTVKIRTRPKRDSSLDDRFGDPFWQNIFGATVPKDINVTSPAQELTVRELPAEGRPADFHGAIGTFSIASDVSPTKADVGDPLTLRMRVTGSGNFDRVDSTMLDHLDQWKTYPPKSSFNTSDPIALSGMKTFEQPVIASKPGVQELPGLTFSYFDPVTRRYATARSPALSVSISPSLADSRGAPQVLSAAALPGDKYVAGLRPDHAETPVTSSLIPLYLQPKFLAVPSIVVLAFAAGWVSLRRRRGVGVRESASDRIASQAAKRALAQMQTAARAGDAAQFFDSARTAVQSALAVRWQLAPEEITTTELENRVGAQSDIRELFALADEAKYSGGKLNATDFARWLRIVRRQLMSEKAA